MNLSKHMRKTLLQIGFGTTYRPGGIFDEEGIERIDGRSAKALVRLGLVFSGIKTGGYGRLLPSLGLTEEGENLFEELRCEDK